MPKCFRDAAHSTSAPPSVERCSFYSRESGARFFARGENVNYVRGGKINRRTDRLNRSEGTAERRSRVFPVQAEVAAPIGAVSSIKGSR